MFRFKQALASARESIARLASKRNTLRAPIRAESKLRPRHPIVSAYSHPSPRGAAVALAPTLSPEWLYVSHHTVPIPLTTIYKSPPTSTITTNAAHASTFSHGSGLLVFINGALMSAANVSLASNIASLNVVNRLSLVGLSTIGMCLGAAFADTRSTVEIAWAEVGDETEREWREAERAWEVFSGGPYEAFEMEKYDEEAFLRRCVKRTQAVSRQGGSEGWYAEEEVVGGGGQQVVGEGQPVMDEVEFGALSDCTGSLSDSSTLLSFEDREAIELVSIKQPQALHDIFTELDSNKANDRILWSPGEGSGPIMSSAEFEALPDWSDVEDDPEWDSTA